MEKKIYYEKKLSAKSNKPYDMVYVDLGYNKLPLTFDSNAICELLDISKSTLMSYEIGYCVCIGALNGKKN